MKITEIPVADYEKVVRAEDPAAGLRAIIAVHSTVLGPALGGMRMWPYATDGEALTDVLRLARGMTYKSAVADTGLGGGKSVLIGNPARDKTPVLFQAMGRFIETLGGRYITAEDVGVAIADLEEVRKTTRHVTGLSRAAGGSGNPAPYTAKGCLVGIRTSVARAMGRTDMKGLHVAIQGVGAVGSELGRLLVAEGARLTIADISPGRAEALARDLGATVATDAEILALPCDVLAPCALGGILNGRTIPGLRCRIVAGCANNQLLDEEADGERLRARGILYAPDYVINSGGIINVAIELEPGGYREAASLARIARIADHLTEVYAIAEGEGIPTSRAAGRLAERRLAAAARPRQPLR